MQKSLLFIAFSIQCIFCVSQKPPIDSSLYGKWPTLSGYRISDDGRHAWYTIENHPVGSQTDVLVSTDGFWKKEYSRNQYDNVQILNNKFAILKKDNSMFFLELGTENLEEVSGVMSYDILKGEDNSWIAYELEDKIIVRDMTSNKRLVLDRPVRYNFCPANDILLLQITKQDGNIEIIMKNLKSDSSFSIWTGKNPENIVFSNDGRKIAFLSRTKDIKRLWIYEKGKNSAVEIVNDNTLGIDDLYVMKGLNFFSRDADRVFISLQKKEVNKPDHNVKLNVWSYTDEFFQDYQLDLLGKEQSNAVIILKDQKVIPLINKGLKGSVAINKYNSDWGIISRYKLRPGQIEVFEGYLVSTKDGSEKKLDHWGTLSPAGKYWVYFDGSSNGFVSLEISTGIKRNISSRISTQWNLIETNGATYPRGIAGWMKDDDASVLVYDLYDIWKIDLQGDKQPINLTNGYGRKSGTMFSFMNEPDVLNPFSDSAKLILSAFNLKTKDNGFYSLTMNRRANPQMLIMGPYAFFLKNNPFITDEGFVSWPTKAEKADVYLIQRQSATEASNLFATKDFKTFTQLSDIHPEKHYNWYTTSLHEWKMPGRHKLQGVLYKPENFNPSRKYPVIFYFYTRRSDNLNVYLLPGPSTGKLNILWYVSNAYLVFTPDIHYEYGNAYESCKKSIESAAEYLSTLRYVDSSKMAIQGISWGGFQTNYLVTHSTRFAAACSASGVADFISHYNSIRKGGYACQTRYDDGNQGPGQTLWQNPEWYVKTSPVMSAHKVTTPFLMFHTTNDGACPFVNAFELYAALRHLGKKVWLLEYTEGDHGVHDKLAMDFDVRMQQFFDHYLKDAPAPKWMIVGVPASQKGFNNGLELVKEKDPKTGKWVTPK